ncbi:MAG: RNA 2',3'-cyclic phosphodiesterase [Patescibacteria group bacterium]
MDKLRLFAAIPIPDDIVKRIFKELESVERNISFPIRFIRTEDMHITLTFLGEQKKDVIASITNALLHTAERFDSPRITFTDITYGPKNRGEHVYTPRMIWLNGSVETSDALGKIKEDFEDQLLDEGLRFTREYRKFTCHVTLARFQAEHKIDSSELNIPFNVAFDASEIQLVQSRLKKSGSEYETLAEFEFQEQPSN